MTAAANQRSHARSLKLTIPRTTTSNAIPVRCQAPNGLAVRNVRQATNTNGMPGKIPVINSGATPVNGPRSGKISAFHLSLAAAASSTERTAQAKIVAPTNSEMFRSALLRSDATIIQLPHGSRQARRVGAERSVRHEQRHYTQSIVVRAVLQSAWGWMRPLGGFRREITST